MSKTGSGEPIRYSYRDDVNVSEPDFHDPEWLHQEWCEKKRSLQDIADEFGVSKSAIEYHANKHNLEAPERKYHFECKECGGGDWVYDSNREKGDGVFCCRECKHKWISENWVGEDNPF